MITQSPAMLKCNIIILFSILLFAAFSCHPNPSNSMKQESPAAKDAAFAEYPAALYPIRVKDKWGYMNRKGEVIIKPSFDDAKDFYGELAVAGLIENKEMLYGYIEKEGNWKIKPAFKRASPFNEGNAVVEKNGLYGYIDPDGNEIIPCQFESAGRFSEGIAAVKKNGWTGFIDTTGTIIIEPKYTCSVDHPLFSHGMAPVFGPDEKTGYINTSGEWVIEPKFHSASPFKGDVAWAMIMEDDVKAQHGFRISGGFINRQGEFIIGPEYDFGWDFSEGHAVVWKISEDRTQKIWSVIDTTGRKVLDNLLYRNVGAMHNGRIAVQDEEMKWGFINSKGEEIIPPQYTGINLFQNGLARMEVGSAFKSTFVYINDKGELIWKE